MKLPLQAPPLLVSWKSILCGASLILASFAPQKTIAQVLTPCEQAFSLGNSPVCKDSVWTFSGEKWYSFVADSSSLSIQILNSVDTTDGHAHSMVLYSGVCGTETQIAFDTLKSETDSLLQIDTNIFIAGNTYLVQVFSNEIGCDKGCGINPVGFEICVQSHLLQYFHMSLAATFIDNCGLNYCMGSVRLNQRSTNVGFGNPQPAVINISCVPPGANILAAYLYFVTVGPTPVVQNVNVNNTSFNAQITGTAGLGRTTISSTCWDGYNTTTTGYVANVTSIVTGNGNYSINGLPAFNPFPFPIPPFLDTDGATLLIIYEEPVNCNLRKGKLYLYDGLSLIESFEAITPPFNMAYTSYSNNINESFFYSIGDVQSNSGSVTVTSFGASNYVNLPVFWEAVSIPATIGNSSTSSFVTHFNGGTGDCSAIPFFGVYMQDGDNFCDHVIANAGPDQSICPGSSAPLNASATDGCSPYSFLWSPASSLNNSTVSNPIASPTITTTYTVTVTDCNGCTSTDFVTVTLFPTPPAPVISGITNNCDANTTYSVPFNPNFTYSWFVTGTFTGQGTNQIIVTSWATMITPIQVCLTITDQNGCTNQSCIEITPCCSLSCPALYFNNTDAVTVYGVSTSVLGPMLLPIVINGAFLVNVPLLQFINCQNIIMGPNAKILIAQGCTLELSGFAPFTTRLQAGCGYMWDGIFVDGNNLGSELIVRGAIVQDAMNAIVSINGGKYTVDKTSDLNKNYKSIVVLPFGGNHPGTVNETRIACLNSPDHPCVTPSPDPSRLIAPHLGERTAVGVEITDVNNITVGLSGPSSQNFFNTFDFMDIGIKALRSNVTVVNNIFQNMQFVPNQNPVAAVWAVGSDASDPPPVFDLNVGGTFANEANTFISCKTGVLGEKNMNVKVVKNRFTGMSRECVLLQFLNANNTAIVDRNDMSFARMGVFCFRNLDINAFILNNTIHDMSFVASGVSIQELSALNSEAKYTVTNNDITEVEIGIKADNIQKGLIDNNRIKLRSPLLQPSFQMSGVEINANLGTTVINNTIRAIPQTSLTSIGGIRASISPMSLITCNNTRFMGYGIKCEGPMASDIFNNRMADLFFGYWLANSGFVGLQDHPVFPGFPSYNTWTGTFTFARCFTSSGTDGIMSPFVYRQGPAQYLPLPSFNNGISAIAVIPTSSGSVNAPSCTIINIGNPLMKSAQLIAQDSIFFPANNSNAQWINKQGLFYNISADNINVSADPVLSQFINSSISAPMGGLASLNLFLSNPSQIQNSGALQNALGICNSINCSNAIESNLRKVNEICLSHYLNGFYTMLQLNDLRVIAAKCPFTDGIAVYQARALLSTIDSIVYTNICEIPDSSSNNMRTLAPSEEVFNVQIAIYPNPAKDEITVEYDLPESQYGQIEIFNTLGEIIAKHLLPSQSNSIQISILDIPEGIYLYTIVINSRPIQSGKLLIHP